MTEISVVIPHLNQPEALRACLDRLLNQKNPPDFEIIVVDNGSAEPPEALCTGLGARFFIEPQPGPGPARNRGASEARGRILAFIDADCLADSNWLAAIAGCFAAARTEIVGGDVRIALADPAGPTALEAYESIFGYRMKLYIERDGYAATCNMAVRRDIFAEVGPFAGISFAEDMNWGQRATAMGYRHIYVPDMRIYTPARARFSELARKWSRHIAHDFTALPSGVRARMRWLLRAGAVAVSPLAEVPRILRSDRLSGSGSRLKAFAALIRIRLYRARVMLALASGADPSALSESWNRV